MKKLSATQQKAIQLAATNGNKLYRHAGGSWQAGKYVKGQSALGAMKYDGVGTSTVRSLVNAGLAEFSEFKRNRAGEFPVEVTIRTVAM